MRAQAAKISRVDVAAAAFLSSRAWPLLLDLMSPPNPPSPSAADAPAAAPPGEEALAAAADDGENACAKNEEMRGNTLRWPYPNTFNKT